jgi:hypothetical protein
VRPGFSKAEILKRRDQDPRLEGGLFDQLGDLLVDLAERR